MTEIDVLFVSCLKHQLVRSEIEADLRLSTSTIYWFQTWAAGRMARRPRNPEDPPVTDRNR
jgi:hypothetical protein